MSAGSQKHMKSGLLSLVTDRMCHFPACRGILLYSGTLELLLRKHVKFLPANVSKGSQTTSASYSSFCRSSSSLFSVTSRQISSFLLCTWEKIISFVILIVWHYNIQLSPHISSHLCTYYLITVNFHRLFLISGTLQKPAFLKQFATFALVSVSTEAYTMNTASGSKTLYVCWVLVIFCCNLHGRHCS